MNGKPSRREFLSILGKAAVVGSATLAMGGCGETTTIEIDGSTEKNAKYAVSVQRVNTEPFYFFTQSNSAEGLPNEGAFPYSIDLIFPDKRKINLRNTAFTSVEMGPDWMKRLELKSRRRFADMQPYSTPDAVIPQQVK